MNPDERVRQSIERWPSIHRHRGDVLEHWFYVLGNGHDWVDGEINEYMSDAEYAEYRQANPMKHSELEILAGADWRSHALLLPLDKISGGIGHLYPTDSYEGYLINSVPKDVKPEWLAVVEEAKLYRRWCILHGVKDSYDNEPYVEAL